MSNYSRDRHNFEWLRHNDQDEPARVMPDPCGNCGHWKRTHDDGTHVCEFGTCSCKGWIPYVERDFDEELHRIASEHERQSAKW